MTHRYEGVPHFAPAPNLHSTDAFQQHADKAIQGIKDIIEGDVPPNVTPGELASETDHEFVEAHKQAAPHKYGGNFFPQFTAVQARLEAQRAVLRGINPEGSTLATMGISMRAIMESVFANQQSRLNRAEMMTKSGIAGSIAVAVAASQRFEGIIPGLETARRTASRAARSIV